MRLFAAVLTTGLVVSFTNLHETLSAETLPTVQVHVDPAEVRLDGNFEQVQLVVRETKKDGLPDADSPDRTRSVSFVAEDDSIVSVDDRGRLLARGNGQTAIEVRMEERVVARIPVEVIGFESEPVVDFKEFVSPILSKSGCNMGACHASQYGKGGFILSVFGFNPDQDWQAIVRDRQQRRVNLLEPNNSLFLLKPTMQVPHGGSRRLFNGSVDHRILAAWLKSGANRPHKDAPKVTGLEIQPSERLAQVGDRQQIRVIAEYEDGRQRDVTAWARFDSMDDAVLAVSTDGYVEVIERGQAPVMARFEGQAAVSTFIVPHQQSIELEGWEDHNFIDELAAAKFRELGIVPSPLCDDATFLRRAFLDATGSTPTVAECRQFLESTDPRKRELLVDRLLGLTGDPQQDIYNDRYAAYWTLKWSDLIRNTSSGGNAEVAMWSLHNWIRESFRLNRPFDEFAAELVTAKGSTYRSGPANYFRINRTSSDLAESTAQIFLGVRLQCAKCHHHPFEKYSQADYYGFAAFFSRVSSKNSQEFGLFGRESVVLVRSTGDVRHPRTGQTLQPTPLGSEPVNHELDRRIPLAEWMRKKDNPYVARNVVNRYMSYLLGRGLVEPVDDMRQTNPPTNVRLMDQLAGFFVEKGFDLKQLIRVIMLSRLYQLDSVPTEGNASDRKFYAFFRARRLPAEPLLDAVDQVTGVQTKFNKLPLGTRAIELPDAEYPNYFLNTFAKPKRASVCECERMPDENLAQALHTLNGDILTGKIVHKQGRIAQLVAEQSDANAIIDNIYLATLCRLPTNEERGFAVELAESSQSPTEGYEDLMWALLNSKQFLFNH